MPSPLITAAQAAPTTPMLVVDVETLDRNIARMAERAQAGPFDLMPHAKTHKCPQIAEKQVSSGAVGLTLATIGEAEVFADLGAPLFIAYPLWLDEGKQRRLAKLAMRAPVRVGVDSIENARRIVGTGARVVIEIDSGHHRTGVQPAEAGALASAVADLGLTVEGVFTFPGHGMAYAEGSTPAEVRAAAARDQETALAEAARSLVAAGVNPLVVSGGSTPTYAHRRDGLISEMRPGVYVFNDAMQVALGSCTVEDVALAAAATVVSVPAPDRFVLDAGSKVLGADPNAWSPGYGLVPAYPGSKVVQLSEHHAVVQRPEGTTAPQHGDRVAIIPNHVCNAVNLAAELVVVKDDEHVDTWPVAARGANA
ncbi:MAG TPA: alanine racemase [Actinospica sp.]|nr:alanine racemase [Actinospica sp.]